MKFPVSVKNMIFILEKYGTSSNRKIKLYAWKYFTMKNI